MHDESTELLPRASPGSRSPRIAPTIAVMTPLHPWAHTVCVGLVLGVHASAGVQTEVHHHLQFEIGAETATVTTTFRGLRDTELRVAMPRFVTRSARLQDLARVHDRLVVEATGGGKVPRSDGAWTIDTRGKSVVALTHQIPLTGRQVRGGLGQRQSHKYEAEGESKVIRYHQGYSLQAATTWLFAIARPGIPQRVTFSLPPGFDVATPLEPGANGSYLAANFAALADSPFHIGTSRTLKFQAAGRSYRVHLTGFGRDRTDLAVFQSQLAKIASSQMHTLGPGGPKNYVFLFGRSTELPTVIGHRNSSEILAHSLRASNAQLLNISRAHLWSWLHPLETPDLFKPPASPESWFLQGVIEYLAEISLVRAGLSDARRFWTTGISTHINKLERDQRRWSVSVADAGMRLHQRGPNKLPAGPDPKTKGLILGLLLDVEIRARSLGTRSLDGVLQALIGRRVPVTNEKIAAACAATLGKPLGSFFKAYVYGTDELPLQASLARVGIDAQTASMRAKKPVNPRIPKTNRLRPPRWYIKWIEKPSDAARNIRTQMTKDVAK